MALLYRELLPVKAKAALSDGLEISVYTWQMS